jgi:hypothetical protein
MLTHAAEQFAQLTGRADNERDDRCHPLLQGNERPIRARVPESTRPPDIGCAVEFPVSTAVR